jgi:hypothetical protein
MADDKQDPGPYNISVIEGDPYSRTLTFTAGGEPWELPTTGWLGQIRRKRDKNSELVGEFTIDPSQAGEGIVVITLPALDASVYHFDIECVGVRTLLAGTVTVRKQVSVND